jgi:hypothetical protein
MSLGLDSLAGSEQDSLGSGVRSPTQVYIAPSSINLGSILEPYINPIENGGMNLSLPSRLVSDVYSQSSNVLSQISSSMIPIIIISTGIFFLLKMGRKVMT